MMKIVSYFLFIHIVRGFSVLCCRTWLFGRLSEEFGLIRSKFVGRIWYSQWRTYSFSYQSGIWRALLTHFQFMKICSKIDGLIHCQNDNKRGWSTILALLVRKLVEVHITRWIVNYSSLNSIWGSTILELLSQCFGIYPSHGEKQIIESFVSWCDFSFEFLI